MPLEFYSIDIIKGGVILMAVLLDSLRTSIASRQTAAEGIS